jgi:hypothetical protein
MFGQQGVKEDVDQVPGRLHIRLHVDILTDRLEDLYCRIAVKGAQSR